MNPELLFTLVASFGATCQEILHWYELRNKLEEADTYVLIRSTYYWAITILMIGVSGVGTWILFYEPETKKSIPFILGAAFPLIFKKAVEVTHKRDLGRTQLTKHNLTFKKVSRQYFQ